VTADMDPGQGYYPAVALDGEEGPGAAQVRRPALEQDDLHVRLRARRDGEVAGGVAEAGVDHRLAGSRIAQGLEPGRSPGVPSACHDDQVRPTPPRAPNR